MGQHAKHHILHIRRDLIGKEGVPQGAALLPQPGKAPDDQHRRRAEGQRRPQEGQRVQRLRRRSRHSAAKVAGRRLTAATVRRNSRSSSRTLGRPPPASWGDRRPSLKLARSGSIGRLHLWPQFNTPGSKHRRTSPARAAQARCGFRRWKGVSIDRRPPHPACAEAADLSPVGEVEGTRGQSRGGRWVQPVVLLALLGTRPGERGGPRPARGDRQRRSEPGLAAGRARRGLDRDQDRAEEPGGAGHHHHRHPRPDRGLGLPLGGRGAEPPARVLPGRRPQLRQPGGAGHLGRAPRGQQHRQGADRRPLGGLSLDGRQLAGARAGPAVGDRADRDRARPRLGPVRGGRLPGGHQHQDPHRREPERGRRLAERRAGGPGAGHRRRRVGRAASGATSTCCWRPGGRSQDLSGLRLPDSSPAPSLPEHKRGAREAQGLDQDSTAALLPADLPAAGRTASWACSATTRPCAGGRSSGRWSSWPTAYNDGILSENRSRSRRRGPACSGTRPSERSCGCRCGGRRSGAAPAATAAWRWAASSTTCARSFGFRGGDLDAQVEWTPALADGPPAAGGRRQRLLRRRAVALAHRDRQAGHRGRAAGRRHRQHLGPPGAQDLPQRRRPTCRASGARPGRPARPDRRPALRPAQRLRRPD